MAIDSDKWDIHEWARLFSNKTIYGHLNVKPMWFSHLFTFFNHLESKKHSNKKFLAHRLYKNRQCARFGLFSIICQPWTQERHCGDLPEGNTSPPEDTANELWTASLSWVEQSKGRGQGGIFFWKLGAECWACFLAGVSEGKTLSEALPAPRGRELILLVTLPRKCSVFIKWCLLNFSSVCHKLKT